MFVHYDDNDAVVAYPFSQKDWETLLNGGSARKLVDMPDERLADYNVAKVAPSVKPEPITDHKVEEDLPAKMLGVWTQIWKQVPMTPEEIAARDRREALKAELDVVKLDGWISQFMAMSPSEAQQSVLDQNTGSSAQKADKLFANQARLAFAVRFLLGRSRAGE